MLSLTVVIPVKNEAVNLPRCLAALPQGVPVVVVDSGSTDATVALARQAGAAVLDFVWDGRFPKKRNWVLRQHAPATDWVLFLDADEYPGEAFWRELEVVLPGTEHAGFWLCYENHFMGKSLRYGDPCPKLALFRVGAGEYERIEEERWSTLDMEVHEHPVLEGTVGQIQAAIRHEDFKGLGHWVAKHNAYAEWEAWRWRALQGPEGGATLARMTPRQRWKYRNLSRWWFPMAYFVGAYVVKRGFLDGRAGLRLALMKAWYFYLIRLKCSGS